jgi:hypothetical protein
MLGMMIGVLFVAAVFQSRGNTLLRGATGMVASIIFDFRHDASPLGFAIIRTKFAQNVPAFCWCISRVCCAVHRLSATAHDFATCTWTS